MQLEAVIIHVVGMQNKKKSTIAPTGCESNNDAVCLGVNTETCCVYQDKIVNVLLCDHYYNVLAEHRASSCSGWTCWNHCVPHSGPVSW